MMLDFSDFDTENKLKDKRVDDYGKYEAYEQLI